LGKGFAGACNTCGGWGHRARDCPKGGGKKGGKGVNGLDDGSGTLDLGGGEEAKTDEGEAKSPEEGSAPQAQPDPGWTQVGPAPYDPNWWCQQNQYAPGGQVGGYGPAISGPQHWQPNWIGILEESQKKQVSFEQDKSEVLNLSPKQDPNYEWVKIDAVMDSGSVVTIGSMGHVDPTTVKPSAASKAGVNYTAADGGTIRNIGEGDVVAMSEDGTEVKFKSQVGDKMTRLLIAIQRAVEAGNMVVLGSTTDAIKKLMQRIKDGKEVPENLIMSRKTGTIDKIKKKNGLYVYPMWIKKKRNNKDITASLEETCGTCGESDECWSPFVGQAM